MLTRIKFWLLVAAPVLAMPLIPGCPLLPN